MHFGTDRRSMVNGRPAFQSNSFLGPVTADSKYCSSRRKEALISASALLQFLYRGRGVTGENFPDLSLFLRRARRIARFRLARHEQVVELPFVSNFLQHEFSRLAFAIEG